MRRGSNNRETPKGVRSSKNNRQLVTCRPFRDSCMRTKPNSYRHGSYRLSSVYRIKICQTAYFELKRISSIRRFLTEDATKALVTSYILSRLDYCNCLLMGTPNSVLQPLQKIQNFAARLVLLAPRHHHATPLLEKTALASHFRTY